MATSPAGRWILLPGGLLLLAAALCAAYATLLGFLLANGGFE